ncbi:MAG: hypothetical protein ACYC61_33460 [Isosphaeraceae bacterium]
MHGKVLGPTPVSGAVLPDASASPGRRAEMLRDYDVDRPEDLSIRQASELIDALNAAARA